MKNKINKLELGDEKLTIFRSTPSLGSIRSMQHIARAILAFFVIFCIVFFLLFFGLISAEVVFILILVSFLFVIIASVVFLKAFKSSKMVKCVEINKRYERVYVFDIHEFRLKYEIPFSEISKLRIRFESGVHFGDPDYRSRIDERPDMFIVQMICNDGKKIYIFSSEDEEEARDVLNRVNRLIGVEILDET